MFVASDDYPYFREDLAQTSKKKTRFNLKNYRSKASKSQESIPDSFFEQISKTETKRKNNKRSKKLPNIDTNDPSTINILDSINEVGKTVETNRNATDLTGENLTTLIKYKKLENGNKKNPIFHLPPIISKPHDPETTFLTFGELDELNERIFQTQNMVGPNNPKTEQDSNNNNKLNLELTYNKTQFEKLRTHYNEEEQSSFKILINNIKTQQIKQNKIPKIKMYSSQQYSSSNAGSSSIFKEITVPEKEEKEKESIIEKKREPKVKRGVVNNENLYFESSIYFYSYEQLGWRPEIRELCTMVLFEKKVYVYSGIGRNIMDDIVVADLGNLTWEKIAQSGEVPSYGRYGHSTVLYNKKMFIFGGEKKYNSHLKQHECLNDVRYFSLENFKWKYIRPIGDLVEARRNHVATIVGRYMIINGGISPKDQYLSDFWSFDFMINKWVSIPVRGANKNGIAFHACCSVFLPERSKIVLNKALESITDDYGKKFIQHEGVYLFGGKNGVYFSNELTILLIDQNPMVLLRPEIGGKPPMPRYGHTMVFNEIQNIVIIYGGRNDYENCFFGDVHILKLDVLCWVSVKTQGIPKPPRASHCACNFGTKLVVFGGLNLNGFLTSDVAMIEFDNSQVKKFVSLENLAIKPNFMMQIEENNNYKENKEKVKESKEKDIKMDELKSKAQMLYLEEEEKLKMKRQKMEILMESLKFQNFKSFLPLPNNNKFASRTPNRAFEGGSEKKTKGTLKPIYE